MRNVVLCLLVSSTLWTGNIAARLIEVGDCVGFYDANAIVVMGEFAINSSFYERLVANSENNYDPVLIEDKKLSTQRDDLFCRCDDSDDSTVPIDPSEARKWVYSSIYSINQTIVSEVSGYKFINVSGMPFNIAVLIDHGSAGFVSVPIQSVVDSNDGCVVNEDEVFGKKQSGQFTTGETANRQLQLVIQQTADIPAGLYEFNVPWIVSYKNLISSTQSLDTLTFNHIESAMLLSVKLSVPEQCSFGGNSIYTVDLGAVDSTAFGDVEGDKPAGYDDRLVDIIFQCNSGITEKASFYLVDGNDNTNSSDILTTNLSGVGVGIEGVGIDHQGEGSDNGRLYLQQYYDQSIDRDVNYAGILSLKAYPVKVGSESVGVGLYRAKATLVVEHE